MTAGIGRKPTRSTVQRINITCKYLCRTDGIYREPEKRCLPNGIGHNGRSRRQHTLRAESETGAGTTFAATTQLVLRDTTKKKIIKTSVFKLSFEATTTGKPLRANDARRQVRRRWKTAFAVDFAETTRRSNFEKSKSQKEQISS